MGTQTGLGSGDSRKQLAVIKHCHESKTFKSNANSYAQEFWCLFCLSRLLRDELLKDFTSDRSMDRQSTPIFAVLQSSRADELFPASPRFSKLFPMSLQIISLELDSTLRKDVRVFFERNASRAAVRHLLTSRVNLFCCSRLVDDAVSVCARTTKFYVLSGERQLPSTFLRFVTSKNKTWQDKQILLTPRETEMET